MHLSATSRGDETFPPVPLGLNMRRQIAPFGKLSIVSLRMVKCYFATMSYVVVARQLSHLSFSPIRRSHSMGTMKRVRNVAVQRPVTKVEAMLPQTTE